MPIKDLSDEELKKIAGIRDVSDEELQRIAGISSTKKPSQLEAGLRGAAQGLTFNFADELAAGLESAFTPKTYKQAVEESRNAYKAAEKEHPGTYLTGSIAGSVAPMLIPGVGQALTLGKGIAGAAATGATMGALGGIGAAEKDIPEEALKGAAFGGVTGAAFGALPKAIDALKSDRLTNLKNILALQSIGTQKLQMKSLGENADEIAKFALQQGIVSPFKGIQQKEDITTSLIQKYGKQLEDLRASAPEIKTQVVVDALKNSLKKENIHPESALFKDTVRQIDDVIQEVNLKAGRLPVTSESPLQTINPNISLKDIVDVKSTVGKKARGAFSNVLESKGGYETARKALRDVEMTSPVVDEAYKQAAQGYSKTATIQELLDNLRNMQANNRFNTIGAGAGATLGGGAGATAGAILGAQNVKRGVGGGLAVLLDKLQQLPSNARVELLKKLDPKIAEAVAQRLYFQE